MGKKKTRSAPRARTRKTDKEAPTYRMRVRSDMPNERRMLARIYNSLRDQGKSHKEAERVATAKVNQFRRRKGLLIEDVGRGRWYPGKAPVKGYSARAAQLLAEGNEEGARVAASRRVEFSRAR